MTAPFFLVDTMAATSRDLCFLRDVPEGTDDISYRMAKGFRMGADHPTDARVAMTRDKPGFQLASVIGNTNAFLIVDKRLRDVIGAARLGEVEFLPLAIVDHKKRIASRDYFVVNPIGGFDCIDRAASDIEWLGDEVVEATKYVFDRAKTAAAPDLFRIRETPRVYVMSAALASACQAAGATNLVLTPVEYAN